MAVLKPFQSAIIKDLISNYRFDQPFNTYFASQARLHKNWGSKDRKIYRQACYAYFRLGAVIRNETVEDNLSLALLPAEMILKQIGPADIFPDQDWVSPRLDFDAWAKSLLYMRPVYLAIKSGFRGKVAEWLESHTITSNWINDHSVQVTAESKCNELVEKGWAWIMDISSQNAAEIIDIKKDDLVWDACSGAGGKALFLSNKYPEINLTCSDRRFSVLENLKERFYTLGFRLPHIELADLNERFQLSQKYDKIIMDVPCSGSGTWGRTPEQISVINEGRISSFSALQKNITRNAIKNLAHNGSLYYITCSVFHAENEDNVRYFCENFGLKQELETYLHGANSESYLRSDFPAFEQTDILYIAKMTFI